MTQEEIEELTDDLAAAPQSVSVDGQTVSEHRLPDLIALEKHRAETTSGAGRVLPVRFFNTKPPGAV